MNPSDSLVIETRDLSKAYKGVQALKDLNLTVKQHSIVGFLGPFLVGVAGLAVNTLFYLALTLMLGVLTANRITLLGASLGLAMLGFLAVPLGATVSMFVTLTPFALIHVLPAAVLGAPLPLPIWLPIGVTAVLAIVSVVVTLARFERLEF